VGDELVLIRDTELLSLCNDSTSSPRHTLSIVSPPEAFVAPSFVCYRAEGWNLPRSIS
jgi:hypothetical protein